MDIEHLTVFIVIMWVVSLFLRPVAKFILDVVDNHGLVHVTHLETYVVRHSPASVRIHCEIRTACIYFYRFSKYAIAVDIKSNSSYSSRGHSTTARPTALVTDEQYPPLICLSHA